MTSFCIDCYASNSEQSAGVRELVEHNLRLLREAATVEAIAHLFSQAFDIYSDEADRMGVAVRDRIFRINWDGDIESIEHAQGLVLAILEHPDIKYWLYTRSIYGDYNVVPELIGVPNLQAYISVDADNYKQAWRLAAQYSEIHLAPSAVDFVSAQALMPSGRRVIWCPENRPSTAKGHKPLVSDEGRGACTDCRWCIEGSCDVAFTTSHAYDVTGGQQSLFGGNVELLPTRAVDPAPVRNA